MLSRAIAAVAILLALSCASPAQEQNYPSKPIRVIVPSAPGGGTDVTARLLVQQLATMLPWTLYVENRAGAGGVIGEDAAAKAAPDGYTLVVAPSTLVTSHLVKKQMPFDVLTDLTPISLILETPNVLIVDKRLPVHSLADFIALLKADPGKYNYGSAGIGTAPHLAMALFEATAGVKMEHIPYKGVAPTMADLIAGRIGAAMLNALSAKPQIDAGTVRALAVAAEHRVDSLPDVPTFAEQGLPAYRTGQWFGLLGPANLDPSVVLKLQKAAQAAVATPNLRKHITAQAGVPIGGTAAEFAQRIREDYATWSKVAKAAGIKPE